jgi:putative inorganic carbon (HCO3(-)) transporter
MNGNEEMKLLFENGIEKTIRYILYTLFLSLPWISLPLSNGDGGESRLASSGMSPWFGLFLPPGRVAGMHGKFTLLAVAAALILFLWVGKILATSKIEFVRTPLDRLIVLFLGIALLSTLFSGNFFKALLGWDRHREGLVTFGIYALIYFAIVNFITDEERARKLTFAVTLGLAISASQAIFQIATRGTEYGNRVTAGFTDPNFYAAFLLMAVPIAILSSLRSRRLYEKLISIFVSLVSIVLLVFTFSRIAYVAAFLSFLLVLGLLWLHRKQRYALVALAIALILLSAGLLLGRFAPQSVLAHLGERVSMSSFSEGLSNRIGLWRLSWKYVFDRPLLGYGPDRYRFATGNSGGFGGAHNEYLYYVITLGWLGLASFLFLVGSHVFGTLRLISKQDRHFGLRAACLAGATGYLMFMFSTYNIPYVAVFFWVLLAITWLPEAMERKEVFHMRFAAPTWSRAVSLSIAPGLLLVVLSQILRLPAGALHWDEAKTLWREGETELALGASKKAVQLVPDSEPYWTDLGGEALYLAKKGRRELLPVAIYSFEKVTSELNKGESPTWFYLGEAYRLAGEREKAKLAYQKAIELGTSDIVGQKAIVVLGETYKSQE